MKARGKSIREGSATILVKYENDGPDGGFIEWLEGEGFEIWECSKGYMSCNWVWVNLDSMVYANGMPGIKVTRNIRDHAITAEEFKTIWKIFKKYEGLSPLDMG